VPERARPILDPFEALRCKESGIVKMPDSNLLRRLAKREMLVLEMIGRGLTYAQIAAVLNRKSGNIRLAKMRLAKKLGEGRTGVLVRFAVETGLVELGVVEIRRRLAIGHPGEGA